MQHDLPCPKNADPHREKDVAPKKKEPKGLNMDQPTGMGKEVEQAEGKRGSEGLPKGINNQKLYEA